MKIYKFKCFSISENTIQVLRKRILKLLFDDEDKKGKTMDLRKEAKKERSSMNETNVEILLNDILVVIFESITKALKDRQVGLHKKISTENEKRGQIEEPSDS